MFTSFPARWTDEGIVFYPEGRSLVGGVETVSVVDPKAVVVRWRRLMELEAVHPWPRFRVRWGSMSKSDLTPTELAMVSGPLPGPGGQTFGPPGAATASVLSTSRLEPDGFAAHVSALFDHVARFKPTVIRRGWLDDPDVDWEPVSELPAAAGATSARGVFRSAAAPAPPIVRGPPSAYEALLEWIASGSERPWSEHPREVRLTADHVYVLRRDRRIVRLPLSLLRARVGGVREDAVYVFGRRRGLLLTYRTNCPVREALDRRLELRAQSQ
jgi:hypothetical protein